MNFQAEELNFAQALAYVLDILESRESTSPLELRKFMAEKGLGICDLSTLIGGSGFSCIEMGELFRTFGAHSLALRDVPGAGHGRMLTCPAAGTSKNFQPLFDKLRTGHAFFGVAFTEEHGGSDVGGIRLEALRVGTGYILNGTKCNVARLGEASHFLVLAKTEEFLSLFLVPADTYGLEVRLIETMGLDEVSFGEITFHDVHVPFDMLVGEEGEGMTIFTKHFAFWRTAMAAAAIGCASGALKQAIGWMQERLTFGSPIARFTHLQQELAVHTSRLHMAWLLVVETLGKIDSGSTCFIEAAMAKAETLEIAINATQWAMLVHGGRGYTRELDVEKRLRDLLGLRVADGVTDVLRAQIARSLLGDGIYELGLTREKRPINHHPCLIRQFLG